MRSFYNVPIVLGVVTAMPRGYGPHAFELSFQVPNEDGTTDPRKVSGNTRQECDAAAIEHIETWRGQEMAKDAARRVAE